MDDELLTLPGGAGAEFLDRETSALSERLRERLGADYRITVGEPSIHSDRWERTIALRKGNRIGADVDVKWTGEKTAVIAVDQASSLQTALIAGLMLPLGLVGAVLGEYHVPPLDFMPFTRLATVVGAVLGLIFGVVIGISILSILGRGHRAENERLLEDVRAVVSTCCRNPSLEAAS